MANIQTRMFGRGLAALVQIKLHMEHPNNSWVQSADFQRLSLLLVSSQLSHRDADHMFRALQMSPALTGIWALTGILSKGTGQALTARTQTIVPARSRASGPAGTAQPQALGTSMEVEMGRGQDGLWVYG